MLIYDTVLSVCQKRKGTVNLLQLLRTRENLVTMTNVQRRSNLHSQSLVTCKHFAVKGF